MAKIVPTTVEESEDVYAYAQQAKAENTRRAYQADWRDFEAYLKKRGRTELPAQPDEVARYLRDLVERRGLKVTTVSRRLAAIAEQHKANGYASPADEWVVRNTLRRLRVEHGSPARGKAPLLTEDLKKIVGIIPDTLAGHRDHAILLLGFAGAMRRRELVGLDVQDLALAPEGLVVSINKSKTDQTRKGRKLGIPYGVHEATCPVRAVLRWLEQAKLTEGPIFRGVTQHGAVRTTRLTDQIVADIVKRYTKAIGKYSTRFSAHSLRAGFITSAAIAGVPERAIQDQSGHQSVTILRRYIRDACIFRFNAAAKVGLGWRYGSRSSQTGEGRGCVDHRSHVGRAWCQRQTAGHWRRRRFSCLRGWASAHGPQTVWCPGHDPPDFVRSIGCTSLRPTAACDLADSPADWRFRSVPFHRQPARRQARCRCSRSRRMGFSHHGFSWRMGGEQGTGQKLGFVASASVPESDWIASTFHKLDQRMMPRNSHPSSAPPPSSEPLGLLNALLPPSLPEQAIKVKTVEEVAVQKAIVCLYLRKRAARVVLNRNLHCAMATARYFEAHHALESIKRVLWRNDWS